MTKFILGDYVVDKISKWGGITMSVSRHWSGMVQYCVQPLVEKDSKEMPKAYDIDDVNLDRATIYTGKEIEFDEQGISLGDRVIDKMTDFEGYVNSITYFQNGCVYASVYGKSVKTLKEIPVEFIPIARLKKKGKALKPLLESTKKASTKKAKTGGPVLVSNKPI